MTARLQLVDLDGVEEEELDPVDALEEHLIQLGALVEQVLTEIAWWRESYG